MGALIQVSLLREKRQIILDVVFNKSPENLSNKVVTNTFGYIFFLLVKFVTSLIALLAGGQPILLLLRWRIFFQTLNFCSNSHLASCDAVMNKNLEKRTTNQGTQINYTNKSFCVFF